MTKKTMPNFLLEAFYEGKFKDNIFVIKTGGKIVEDTKTLDNLMANIRDLTLRGIKVLLVYGHGKAVDDRLNALKIDVKKINGRRVTDAPTMRVIQEIVGGTLSMNIAGSMARNNLQGMSFSSVPHDWMKISLRPKNPVDYGFVGDIAEVEADPIFRLFKVTNFIACSCLGMLDDGQACNINADTVATELAIGLKVHKLIFLSDVDGVQVDGKTAAVLTMEEIPPLISRGVAQGGMQVKLESCYDALKSGVRRIHLISGLRRDALRKEIYESTSPGTMLIQEEEREIYAREIEAQRALERHAEMKKAAS